MSENLEINVIRYDPKDCQITINNNPTPGEYWVKLGSSELRADGTISLEVVNEETVEGTFTPEPGSSTEELFHLFYQSQNDVKEQGEGIKRLFPEPSPIDYSTWLSEEDLL